MPNIKPITYDAIIENALEELSKLLKGRYHLSKRAIGLLLLQNDEETLHLVSRQEKARFSQIQDIISSTQQKVKQPLIFLIAMRRQQAVEDLVSEAVAYPKKEKEILSEKISRITLNPITGIPLLLLVIYFGLYQFVGVFGAGTLVDYLETNVFEANINPLVNNLVALYIPWAPLQELLAGEYGIITLGVRYAVAIVLPIVGTFFFVFSIIEDSGYLPRLAMLVDRAFKIIGLNGRAVIPMTLGFGCDTMATMVSRTLESKRERIITTLLLALAIPCSAQLGVILALLSSKPGALIVWAGFILLVFLIIGYLTAKLLPGNKPDFYMELPPLRFPHPANVFKKTYSHMYWYFLEVLPLFVLASVLIWLGKITGLFDLAITALTPLVKVIGLPPETAKIFLFGFFRRDYGAAGLYDLQQAGALSGVELVVSAATLTLFVPCIAQFIMMVKERGWKTAAAIALFIFPFAFLCGYLLNFLLTCLEITF